MPQHFSILFHVSWRLITALVLLVAALPLVQPPLAGRAWSDDQLTPGGSATARPGLFSPGGVAVNDHDDQPVLRYAGGASLSNGAEAVLVTPSFTIDALAPSAPTINTPMAGSYVTTTLRPVISGGGELLATVTVTDSGQAICTSAVAGDGSWSCTPGADLAQGPHTISVAQADPGGTVSPAATRSFTIDTIAPLAPGINYPTVATNQLRPTLRGDAGAAEAGATLRVREGTVTLCTATVAGNGSWSCIPSTDLSLGPHTILVTQTDPGGNTSPVTVRTFSVDQTAPAAPVINFPLADAYIAYTRFSFNGTSEADAAITVQEGGVTLCTTTAIGTGWSCMPAANLSQGAHTVSITQTDPAGNPSPAATRSFTVDSLAPAAPLFTSPAAGSYLATLRPAVTGTGEAGATLTLREGTLTLCTTTVGTDGKWSCTPTSDLGQGAHSLRAFQTDVAGNDSAATMRSFTVDTVAPAAPVVSFPAAGKTTETLPTFGGDSGAAEVGAGITVQEGGGTLCTATAASDGSWSCTSSVELGDGAHTISVTQADRAGNVSAPTTRSFFVQSGQRLFLPVTVKS